MTAALGRSMGEANFAQVRQEFDRRAPGGRVFAPQIMDQNTLASSTPPQPCCAMERETIGQMQEGNRRGYGDPMLVEGRVRIDTEDRHPELNAGQRQVVDEVFSRGEKIVGLDGVAGTGKTTTLAVVLREGAEQAGYDGRGFAPNVPRGPEVGEAGIETKTLQAHLAPRPAAGHGRTPAL